MKQATFKVVQIPLLTEDELAGVGMIQALQQIKKIKEPFDKALAAWRKMTPFDRDQTRAVYRLLCGKGRN